MTSSDERSADASNEDPQERRQRELNELLQELRVMLPGVQFLFAFLLTVPFSSSFGDVKGVSRGIFFVALMSAAAATVFFMAAPTNHRMRWREHDRERLLRLSNRNTIIATALLAIAMVSSLYVVASFIFSVPAGVATAVAVAALILVVWYLIPILMRHDQPER